MRGSRAQPLRRTFLGPCSFSYGEAHKTAEREGIRFGFALSDRHLRINYGATAAGTTTTGHFAPFITPWVTLPTSSS